jgi:prevent-host-death family protein
MDVGVRELKQRLSEYLDRAARGERIIVTDRGRPKATLGPLAGGDHIDRGVDEGWITPPAKAGPAPPPPPRRRGGGPSAALLGEGPDEGRATSNPVRCSSATSTSPTATGSATSSIATPRG